MTRLPIVLFFVTILGAAAPCAAQDQDPQTGAGTGASQQVEESDEAYRRRMELEDARRRDPTYVDAQAGYQRELEKVDHLPEASRDHIREQLIDVIMESGGWTPEDARRDYPYSPSPAAQGDPALAQREQEAWDEQIEKYHAREAAAFGAARPPAGRTGDPSAGTEGGTEGSSGQDGGSEGQSGEGASGAEAASQSTYQPYEPARQADDERASTAGVSQSALDFILGQRGTPPAEAPPGSGNTSPIPTPSPAATAEASPAPAEDSESGEESAETPPDMRGILAIEDLDKLGDSVRPAPPPEENDKESPPDDG